jgi:hypothetical protein
MVYGGGDLTEKATGRMNITEEKKIGERETRVLI